MSELQDLKEEQARIAQRILDLEAEATRARLPLDVELSWGTSKHSNDETAANLGLEGDCANYFRYSGLEVLYKATIESDGTVMMHEIREPKSKEWVKLTRSIKLNCA